MALVDPNWSVQSPRTFAQPVGCARPFSGRSLLLAEGRPQTCRPLKRSAIRASRALLSDSWYWRKPMPQSEQFEVLVLGSGFGGKLLAWHLAKSGRRTAVVERRWVTAANA